jgi:YVTN family beta-propeller protein
MGRLPRGTVTLLFTDIEGSTILLRALGRERYVEALETHRRLLRQAFGRHGGVEVEMQGDSFFFVFPYAREAAAAAAEAQRALADHPWPDAPIRVRMGLHTGEPAVSGDLYAGLDVHRAARVMAAGHGGQVLLSSRTSDFIVGELPPDIRMRPLGTFVLKDFEGGEPLSQLVVDGLPQSFPPPSAERVPSRFLRLLPRPARRRPRLAAASVVVAAAAVAVPLALIHAAPVRLDANALAEVDLASGRVFASIPVGDRPSALASSGGALWVANAGEATISRVDPRAGRVVRTIPVAGTPLAVTVGGGSVWVLNSDLAAARSSISRIDPRYSRVVATIPLPSSVLIGSGAGIAWDGHAVWAVTQAGGAFRIDPATNRVTATVPVGDDPVALVASDGSVWVASRRDSTISRIEAPATVTATVKVGVAPSSIAVVDGALWVADTGENAVSRIDPKTGSVVATVRVGRAPVAVAGFGRDVWVGNRDDRTLTHIDAATDRVTKTVHLAYPPAALSVVGNRTFVALQQPPPPTAKAGETLQVLSVAPGAIDSVDPALAYTVITWQLEYATCAKLVNYADADGADGFALRPEVANSLPRVSRDGLTYRFTLRRGYRFSPPSNQEVTARTFKYSIERALAPGTKSYADNFLSDLVGARAYERGRAPHIAGLSARGNTLKFRLDKPAGDLAARLAMPFFCAVPIGTPIDFKGLAGIPSAGPYYVASYQPNALLLLRRNPNYHGPRPHSVAAIDVRIGDTENAALKKVERNESDLVIDADGAAVVPKRYHDRFFRYRAPTVRYLALNTRRPLFARPAARQAVARVLDRSALIRFDPTLLPTEALLPPGFPGADPLRAFTAHGEIAVARRLLGAKPATAVYLTCDQPTCLQEAAILRRQLGRIGISLRVSALPADQLVAAQSRRNATFDITDWGWAADYVDPADFLAPLATAAGINFPQLTNAARFTDPGVERAFARATHLAGQARIRAFTALEWRLRSSDVPYVAIANDTRPVIFSTRTRCRINNPVYGLDLAALCIRSPR